MTTEELYNQTLAIMVKALSSPGTEAEAEPEAEALTISRARQLTSEMLAVVHQYCK